MSRRSPYQVKITIITLITNQAIEIYTSHKWKWLAQLKILSTALFAAMTPTYCLIYAEIM